MIRNYLKITLRNLLKNKVFSLINILGLALGMAACILIWQYVRFELSYDQFQSKADRLYRVTLDYYKEGEFIVSDVGTHNTIGPAVHQDIAGVENYARLFPLWWYSLESEAGKFANDIVMLADSSFLTMFDLQWVEGTAQGALQSPYSAVITEELADKHFPGQNALGNYIKYIDTKNNVDIKVTGIVKGFPANSHLHFDMLISRHTPLQDWGLDPNWNGNNDVTYILLEEHVDPQQVAGELAGILKKYQPESSDRYIMQKIRDIHLYSHKTYELEENGDGKLVYALFGVSFFIMVIAWINFINLTTARSLERAKEVGIRKTMGSARPQLIKQFMIEAIAINLIALVLAITFSQLMGNLFSTLVGSHITSFSVLSDELLMTAMAFLFFLGCLATGLYPAVILSSYQPLVMLKGKFSSSRIGQRLRKALVFFQYAVATILISGVIIYYKQYNFMQQQDLGMDIGRLMVFRLPILQSSDKTDSLFNIKSQVMKQKLMDHHRIKGVAISEALPGHGIWELNSTRGIRRAGDPPNENNFYFYGVDEAFFPLLNIRFASGRNFQQELKNDEAIIINESTRELLGFEDNQSAVDQEIRFWGRMFKVIGVVKDHHHHSLDKTIDPILYLYDGGGTGSYVTVKINALDLNETIRFVESAYRELQPREYFDYHFMEDTYASQYDGDRRMARSFATFSLLAIFIACLGLFGLSYFNISQRTKEIGIRKVLGASVTSLFALLTFRFLSLVIISSLVVVPLTYYLAHSWLEGYAFKTELDWWIFLTPGGIMMIIAIFTVAAHTVRAASANPAQSLKYE